MFLQLNQSTIKRVITKNGRIELELFKEGIRINMINFSSECEVTSLVELLSKIQKEPHDPAININGNLLDNI